MRPLTLCPVFLLLIYCGISLGSEPVTKGTGLEKELYIRALYGIGTDTPLNKIIRGELVLDEERTAIVGLQVGTPIVENIFDWPVDLIVNAALVRHLDKGLQPDANEYAVAVKAYYDGFSWNDTLGTRVFTSTGLSYADRIPANEKISLAKKGPVSHLMLHIELGIDFNLGDLFDVRKLKSCFAGFTSWHRSGVFGGVSLFNNADGGYNWVSLSLECIHRY